MKYTKKCLFWALFPVFVISFVISEANAFDFKKFFSRKKQPATVQKVEKVEAPSVNQSATSKTEVQATTSAKKVTLSEMGFDPKDYLPSSSDDMMGRADTASEIEMATLAVEMDECNEIKNELRLLRYVDYQLDPKLIVELVERASEAGCFMQCSVADKPGKPQNSCDSHADCISNQNNLNYNLTCCLGNAFDSNFGKQCVPAGTNGCPCMNNDGCTSGICVNHECKSPSRVGRAQAGDKWCEGPCCNDPCRADCWGECIKCNYDYKTAQGFYEEMVFRHISGGEEIGYMILDSIDVEKLKSDILAKNRELSFVKIKKWYESCPNSSLNRLSANEDEKTSRAKELCREAFNTHVSLLNTGYNPDADLDPFTHEIVKDILKSSEPTLSGEVRGDGWGFMCDTCPNWSNPSQQGYSMPDAPSYMRTEAPDYDNKSNVVGCRVAVSNPYPNTSPDDHNQSNFFGHVIPERSRGCLKSQLWSPCDNCPTVPNSRQEDFDSDGIGDACDACPNLVGTTCETGKFGQCSISNVQVCASACNDPAINLNVTEQYIMDLRRSCCTNNGQNDSDEFPFVSELLTSLHCTNYCKDMAYVNMPVHTMYKSSVIGCCAQTAFTLTADTPAMCQVVLGKIPNAQTITGLRMSDDNRFAADAICQSRSLASVPHIYKLAFRPCLDVAIGMKAKALSEGKTERNAQLDATLPFLEGACSITDGRSMFLSGSNNRGMTITYMQSTFMPLCETYGELTGRPIAYIGRYN